MATIKGFHLNMSSLISQEHKSQVLHATNLLCLQKIPYPRSSSSFNKLPRKVSHDNRVMVAKAMSHADSSQPEPHQVPAKSPFSAWKHWLVGLTLSILIPSLRQKKRWMWQWKGRAESVTEVVEELAEDVEKVSEQVAEKLPDDAKLKKAVESVEHLAEEAVEKAKQAEDIIHKVKEVEEEVEEALISGSDKDIPNRLRDQKET